MPSERRRNDRLADQAVDGRPPHGRRGGPPLFLTREPRTKCANRERPAGIPHDIRARKSFRARCTDERFTRAAGANVGVGGGCSDRLKAHRPQCARPIARGKAGTPIQIDGTRRLFSMPRFGISFDPGRASFQSCDKNDPSKSGIKHLAEIAQLNFRLGFKLY